MWRRPRTTVKLPDDLDARLRHEAERRGMTVSELTRQAIETHLVEGGKRRLGADDAEHGRCRRLLQSHPGPVLVPVLVVTEVGYLLGTRVGAETEVRFLGDLAAGELLPEQVAPADWLRIAELVATYRDLPLGRVDASLIAAAERLGTHTIATLDRRHFSVVRPAHTRAFDLVP